MAIRKAGLNSDMYNGWANYETWCVNLWLTNNEDSQDMLDRFVQAGSLTTYDRAESLKGYIQELAPNGASMFTDLVQASLSMVDWREIIENHADDYEEVS